MNRAALNLEIGKIPPAPNRLQWSDFIYIAGDKEVARKAIVIDKHSGAEFEQFFRPLSLDLRNDSQKKARNLFPSSALLREIVAHVARVLMP